MAFSIPTQELRFRASRARGPGGQHVNKAATKVEVVWNIAASPSLSDDQRARLLRKLETRIDARGQIRIAADGSRSQARNREAAVERLHALVNAALRRPKPRKKTKPSRAAVERRLQAKRERADRKQRRGPVRDDD